MTKKCQLNWKSWSPVKSGRGSRGAPPELDLVAFAFEPGAQLGVSLSRSSSLGRAARPSGGFEEARPRGHPTTLASFADCGLNRYCLPGPAGRQGFAFSTTADGDGLHLRHVAPELAPNDLNRVALDGRVDANQLAVVDSIITTPILPTDHVGLQLGHKFLE